MAGLMSVETSVIIAVIGILGAPFAAWVGWLLNKKKTGTDISGSIAVASGSAVDAIRDVMDSLREELKATKEELAKFKIQNKLLEESLEKLHDQNALLLEQNEFLALEIASLKKEIDRII